MRELTIPAVGTPTENSAARYVFNNADHRPQHEALRIKSADGWRGVSSAEFAAAVSSLGRGLIAVGIGPGDRIALMSKTRYEWTLVDFAVLAIGAIVVPIYETSSAEQMQWILQDSQARAIVLETSQHRALLEGIRGELSELEHVWQLEGGSPDAEDLDSVTKRADSVTEEILRKRLDATVPSDIASIIYTSGTTGRPKGCALTHANLLAEVFEVSNGLDGLFNSENSTLLFLPLAHVFGRAIAFGAIANGTTLGHTSDVVHLVEELTTFRPTFVLAVPRVFEKVHNGAKQKAHEQGKGAIFDRAERVAVAYSEAIDARGPSLGLRLQHALFDKLVYSKIRAALGGRCKAAISGGAPLGKRLGHFFRGVGVTVYEGYGLTETTAGVCLNVDGLIKIGSVGRPIASMSMRIADDGELLMAGPMVFSHYWRNEAATAEALAPANAEGPAGRVWFHTGDLAEIDNDGFVSITGRKKELIVTANGKNVAPAGLEDRIRQHWLVDQCLVVGDRMPYIAALITLDCDAWPTWLRRRQLPVDTTIASQANDAALLAELQKAVDEANLGVSHAEAIKKFSVLPAEWTEASGQLTPSMKLKRNLVLRESEAEIAALYGPASFER